MDGQGGHKREAAIRRLLDCSPLAHALIDPHGRILFMNRASYDVSCRTRNEVVGTSFFSHFVDSHCVRARFDEVLRTGNPACDQFEIRLGDGTIRTMEFSFGRLDDEDGRPTAVFSTACDVSTVIGRQQRALSTPHHSRSLIEASLDPLFTINVEGMITDVNQATMRATGLEREELIGRDFTVCFTEPERARLGHERVFFQGSVTDYPLSLRTANGGTLDVLYNASLYHDADGHVAGVFAAARDVTLLHRSQRALEETNRDMTMLGHMTSLLQSCENFTEAFNVITPTLELLFPDVSGVFYLVGPSIERLELRAAWGDEHARLAVTQIEAGDCWSLRRGHIHEAGIAGSINPRCRHAVTDTGPSLCIPLVAHGTALGVVHLIAHQDVEPDRFDHWKNRAATFADSMSLSLANLRLRESLHSMSMRDTLTGLYNRRFMQEALERELHRMHRAGRPLVVAMFDIDHFKSVNDQYGHDVGDEVLRRIAKLMEGFRQGSDVACRYGGEEFLLILPEVEPEIARRRLERFREEVAAMAVHLDDRTQVGVTISIGIAAFPSSGRTSSALIRAADAALYRAKEAGRNRIEFAPFHPPVVRL